MGGSRCRRTTQKLARNRLVGDYSPQVLVLYLKRPGGTVGSRMILGRRFGYSDLKEAAPRQGHVL